MVLRAISLSLQDESPTAYPPISEKGKGLLKSFVVDHDKLRRMKRDNVDGSYDCSICQDEMILGTQGTQLPCKHYFCTDCIMQWLERSRSCPVCRSEIVTESEKEESSRQQQPHHTPIFLARGGQPPPSAVPTRADSPWHIRSPTDELLNSFDQRDAVPPLSLPPMSPDAILQPHRYASPSLDSPRPTSPIARPEILPISQPIPREPSEPAPPATTMNSSSRFRRSQGTPTRSMSSSGSSNSGPTPSRFASRLRSRIHR